MNIPTGYKYADTDEWVRVEGNLATIGVSDFAQDQLSDVVFVEIAVSVNDTVKKGALLGTIESVKAASDINLPISGKVVEINPALENAPEAVNTGPYDQGWMIVIEPADAGELKGLLTVEAYRDKLKG